MSASFYVTTPIYYVNDEPHIGHAYTTVLADTLARFHRLFGDSTRFLTGTDEHGQKVQQAAEKRGIEPQQHCDEMVERFRAAWRRLEISQDDFIRTTEERHQRVVRRILTDLHAKGEIYTQRYEGLYCVPDERFWTPKDVVEGKCPLCGREVTSISEENYFFRMGNYQEWLIEHISSHPEFIQPESRRNEVLGFLKKPLGDLCISRPASRLRWGIPLPFDPGFVTYVWFDALINYLSAVDGLQSPGGPWWPATLHLIGKDILTTHSVYWSTMLRAAGLPLPRTILAHGWWLVGETKMGKSLGNAVKPLDLLEVYGADAFRYFLMRDMVVGQDSEWSEEALIGRINADLANDLGNCLNRVERMIQNYAGAKVPAVSGMEPVDQEIVVLAETAVRTAVTAVREVRLHQAIEETFQLVRAVNKYLEVKAPWKAVKQEGQPGVATTLAVSAEALRLAAVLLSPVMPRKCGEVLHRLGVLDQPDALVTRGFEAGTGGIWTDDLLRWGGLPPGTPLRPAGPLFPRIETT
ncbi:MAG: methionine--tRNA ligase [Candidatus Eisenbacteria bacterium]|nr:methionine--tRNA ligase [Candidatus Eisenbacteria bacterium]MCC7142698.1 methionine--tRNA ligase [Candidatus Eisenbacteria bacterium]